MNLAYFPGIFGVPACVTSCCRYDFCTEGWGQRQRPGRCGGNSRAVQLKKLSFTTGVFFQPFCSHFLRKRVCSSNFWFLFWRPKIDQCQCLTIRRPTGGHQETGLPASRCQESRRWRQRVASQRCHRWWCWWCWVGPFRSQASGCHIFQRYHISATCQSWKFAQSLLALRWVSFETSWMILTPMPKAVISLFRKKENKFQWLKTVAHQ